MSASKGNDVGPVERLWTRTRRAGGEVRGREASGKGGTGINVRMYSLIRNGKRKMKILHDACSPPNLANPPTPHHPRNPSQAHSPSLPSASQPGHHSPILWQRLSLLVILMELE